MTDIWPAGTRAIIEGPQGERTITAEDLRTLRRDLERFELEYQFALREMETKISILQDEFTHVHDYNPIEHVSSRVKTFDSIVAKAQRKGVALDLESLREEILDIAGLRLTCSFTRDVYRLYTLLTDQPDVTVVETKDYIRSPKPNGYRSLHAIITTPVHLSSGPIEVPVEIQFRTIAMDFWASLEHKIHYKYQGEAPQEILDELCEAATTAAALDVQMEKLHNKVHGE